LNDDAANIQKSYYNAITCLEIIVGGW